MSPIEAAARALFEHEYRGVVAFEAQSDSVAQFWRDGGRAAVIAFLEAVPPVAIPETVRVILKELAKP